MCDESLWENWTHNVSQFTQQQPQHEAARTWHPPGEACDRNLHTEAASMAFSLERTKEKCCVTVNRQFYWPVRPRHRDPLGYLTCRSSSAVDWLSQGSLTLIGFFGYRISKSVFARSLCRKDVLIRTYGTVSRVETGRPPCPDRCTERQNPPERLHHYLFKLTFQTLISSYHDLESLLYSFSHHNGHRCTQVPQPRADHLLPQCLMYKWKSNIYLSQRVLRLPGSAAAPPPPGSTLATWSHKEDMETGRPEMKVNKERGRRCERTEVDVTLNVLWLSVAGRLQVVWRSEVRGMCMLVNHNQ